MDGRAERLADRVEKPVKIRNVVAWIPVIILSLLSFPAWFPAVLQHITGIESGWWLFLSFFPFAVAGAGLGYPLMISGLMKSPRYRGWFGIQNMGKDHEK
jgi:hypothetical protein